MLAEACVYPTTQEDPELERYMTEGQVVADAGAVAHVRLAVAAAALERFRLAEGHLPDSLADLTPTFLDRVPLDPFDEKPVRYRKLPVGYVLYSIGRDGQDDFDEGALDQRELQMSPDIAFIVRR
jgi:hypothetical protein